MAFQSAEEAQQRKANFFSAHDVIEAHNNKPGVTFNWLTTNSPSWYNSSLRIQQPNIKHFFNLLVRRVWPKRRFTWVLDLVPNH